MDSDMIDVTDIKKVFKDSLLGGKTIHDLIPIFWKWAKPDCGTMMFEYHKTTSWISMIFHLQSGQTKKIIVSMIEDDRVYIRAGALEELHYFLNLTYNPEMMKTWCKKITDLDMEVWKKIGTKFGLREYWVKNVKKDVLNIMDILGQLKKKGDGSNRVMTNLINFERAINMVRQAYFTDAMELEDDAEVDVIQSVTAEE